MASAALAMTQEPTRIDRAEAEPPPACTRPVSPVTNLTRRGVDQLRELRRNPLRERGRIIASLALPCAAGDG
jgi:hypothetical protein